MAATYFSTIESSKDDQPGWRMTPSKRKTASYLLEHVRARLGYLIPMIYLEMIAAHGQLFIC
jgi:hypothetical protein